MAGTLIEFLIGNAILIGTTIIAQTAQTGTPSPELSA